MKYTKTERLEIVFPYLAHNLYILNQEVYI